ncbi:MAG: CRISPR-associated protein Csc2 [Thermotogota bacterium]|jgi:CRISPR-associated protein Csc2|nr:MAG: CRISPR-associated protein Csc2 [bacterium 42_11]MDK2864850.1 CRISPR-associated protein Csc2 [Thermotogota bacterium]HBT25677.1 type I-D CRISPR-associated protein Cas7/Csc2 [Pseudothermotoga sp.]HCZ07026.1 type I-D CRISPR-associated protein Cas7/Csc2 [Thermotogota bacterium]
MALRGFLEENFGGFFHDEAFPVKPTGRYISIVLLRKTESEAIFRTDEGITQEMITLGIEDKSKASRVIFSKRKAIAMERRKGRELLRLHDLIKETCNINGSMCGECADCLVYGYAAAGKGESAAGGLKSRVLAENAYSILPASEITDVRTINALSEMETMSEPDEKGELQMRESLASNEYVKPETHFIDVETLRDVRPAEFVYVLGNILRTKRYGAISSRMGKIKNSIVAIVTSDSEPFSCLELTKMVWDKLEPSVRSHPLDDRLVEEALLQSVETVLEHHPGNYRLFSGQKLQELLQLVKEAYENPEVELIDMIKNLSGLKAAKG